MGRCEHCGWEQGAPIHGQDPGLMPVYDTSEDLEEAEMLIDSIRARVEALEAENERLRRAVDDHASEALAIQEQCNSEYASHYAISRHAQRIIQSARALRMADGEGE